MKNIKLFGSLFGIFIAMPLNGWLFTRYDAWFPLLLIAAQAPMIIGIIVTWYNATDERGERVNNMPGHRTPPPVPPRRRNNLNEGNDL